MLKFETDKITQVKGRIPFLKLKIEGICEFDRFVKELEETVEGKKIIKTIYAIMDSASNLNNLPKEKFRELKARSKSDLIKDYEIKKGEIRVYLFSYSGYIVVFSGTKNKQREDIARLRRIKKEYKEFKEL
jgi:hypothetical protein